jgi:hypothetical protein
MKQKIISIFLIFAAALVFAQTPAAVIQELTGTVELKTTGSEKWVAAKAGDRIAEATIISTGFKSMAILAVGNSILTVRPLTRMSLEALMSRDNVETINIGLHTGRIKVDVKPPAGTRAEFSVQTPVATASVRGTVFEMDTVKLRVIDGTVRYVSSSAGVAVRPVMVGAGKESRVDPDSGITINPIALAELSRGLPPMPGTPPAADSRSLQIPQGSVSVSASIIGGN